jgi:hypothetical protein
MTVIWGEISREGFNCTSDSLECPILKSGMHKWSIKILEGTAHGLGVCCTKFGDLTRDACYLFESVKLRHYRLRASSQTKMAPPISFSADTIVTFTLDLDRHNGILTASINGNAPFDLFSGLREGVGENEGFVPSVIVKRGRVGFLGFEETP